MIQTRSGERSQRVCTGRSGGRARFGGRRSDSIRIFAVSATSHATEVSVILLHSQ